MSPGGSSGRKCTPATIASLVSTSSLPAGGSSSAASSAQVERARGAGRERPQPLGDERELAVRHRASAPQARGRRRARTVGRTQLARQPVEHGVDEPRLVPAQERVRQLDILVDHDLDRHLRARRQLEGAGAQAGAQQVAGAGERPALGKRRLDQRVELGRAPPGALGQRREPCAIDRERRARRRRAARAGRPGDGPGTRRSPSRPGCPRARSGTAPGSRRSAPRGAGSWR